MARRPDDKKYEQWVPLYWCAIKELFEYAADLVAEAAADERAGRTPRLEKRKLPAEVCRRLGVPEGTMDWKVPGAIGIALSEQYIRPCPGRDNMRPCDQAHPDGVGNRWRGIRDFELRAMTGTRMIRDEPMCKSCRSKPKR